MLWGPVWGPGFTSLREKPPQLCHNTQLAACGSGAILFCVPALPIGLEVVSASPWLNVSSSGRLLLVILAGCSLHLGLFVRVC